jgi:CxxC motif-containing protein (DUF1111 family)
MFTRAENIAISGTVFITLFVLDALSEDVPREPSQEAFVSPVFPDEDPPAHLSPDEAALWSHGRELFTRRWETADGLGTPAFNAQSCAHCHHVPGLGGAGPNDVNVLGVMGFGSGGGYNQPKIERDEEILTGDVQALLRDVRDRREVVKGMHPNLIFERQTPSLYGLALIDSIPATEIKKHAQKVDTRDARIRGRARGIRVGGRPEVGRFGWKAQAPHVRDFVCMALGGELGVTAPNQGRGFGLSRDKDGTHDPEVTQEDLDALILFVSELVPPPPPPPPAPGSPEALQLEHGEGLFEEVGCATCHVPVMMGTGGPVPLYSDLLMHRVLREFKGRGRAARFRTPPLWGVRDTAPYLHDGRARTLRDAILLHSCEAVPMRKRFEALEREDQDALVAFVASLPLPQLKTPRPHRPPGSSFMPPRGKPTDLSPEKDSAPVEDDPDAEDGSSEGSDKSEAAKDPFARRRAAARFCEHP